MAKLLVSGRYTVHINNEPQCQFCCRLQFFVLYKVIYTYNVIPLKTMLVWVIHYVRHTSD